MGEFLAPRPMSCASLIVVFPGLPFNLGVWLGCTIIMHVCTAYLGVLTTVIPRIVFPLQIIGASYMLWLAW